MQLDNKKIAILALERAAEMVRAQPYKLGHGREILGRGADNRFIGR